MHGQQNIKKKLVYRHFSADESFDILICVTVEAVSGRTLLLHGQSFHFVSSVVAHWIPQQLWHLVCVFPSCTQWMDNDVDHQNHR